MKETEYLMLNQANKRINISRCPLLVYVFYSVLWTNFKILNIKIKKKKISQAFYLLLNMKLNKDVYRN